MLESVFCWCSLKSAVSSKICHFLCFRPTRAIFKSASWNFHACVVNFTQHHVLTDNASWRAQRTDLWRSDGHRQSRRLRIILLATQDLRQLERTQSRWMIWLLERTTRSQCGLSALKNSPVTTSRVPAVQVQRQMHDLQGGSAGLGYGSPTVGSLAEL